MYPLGKHFEIDTNKAFAKKENTFIGKNYRITIITDRLIRLEYSKTGLFTDLPTELALNRSFGSPKITKKEDENVLELETNYFHLTYIKNQPFGRLLFPKSNLKIELKGTDKTWYKGHPEIRNYGGLTTMDDVVGKAKFDKGLFSIDGFTSIDDSEGLIFGEDGVLSKRTSNQDDIYVFMYHNDFGACLGDYFMLTGLPTIPPRFALGNLWCKDGMKSEREIYTLLNTFKKNNIPLSALILSSEWNFHGFKPDKTSGGGYTWNKKLFSNPGEFVNYIHKRDLQIGLQILPKEGIRKYEPEFNKIIKYLQKSQGLDIPFIPYDPRYIDTYLKVLLHPNEQLGVDFYWDDSIFKNKHEQFLLNNYHYKDINRNNNKRGMILSRRGSSAPHRYPVITSGNLVVNWENLKMLPLLNINAANMGVSFISHDIGGYYGGIEDKELYIRSIQLGTFSPIMRFHAKEGIYYKREPWRWDLKTHEIAKKYLQLRHDLIPYLYSESYKYHTSGKTLVQPMYYRYPEYYDDGNYKNQYFFGSELLIAPIIDQKDIVMNRVKKDVFFPNGNWYDLVSGKKYPGGKSYTLFFKDEEYPVFTKEGAIIVYGRTSSINNTDVPTTLVVEVFPGRGNTYELYEDDGKTNRHKDGYFLKTRFDKTIKDNIHMFVIMPVEGRGGVIPAKRNYEIKFRNTKTPKDIKIYENDVIVNHQFEPDGNDFTLKFNQVETASQIKIVFSGEDLYINEFRKINEDIEDIISDLVIKTALKEKINEIIFKNIDIKKKRIEIKKLKKLGLEKKFINLFLDLLEYVSNI